MRRRQEQAKLKGVFIALALLLLLLSPVATPLRRGLVLAVRPIGHELYRLGVASSPFQPLADGQMAADRRNLEAELATVRAENESLRRQLEMSKKLPFKTVAAEVVGRSNDPLHRRLLINRGTRHGLRPQLAVMADGYLAGKVIRSDETISEIELITDPGFRLTVTVGQAPTPGLAHGSLGGLTVERLLATELVAAGDKVLSSDIGGQVPSGLPVGTARAVALKDEVFYEVSVETPLQIETLRFVVIVLPP